VALKLCGSDTPNGAPKGGLMSHPARAIINANWLVVYRSSEKYEFVSWEYYSQYMEKMFQTINYQLSFISSQ
jgi:hypothetical protein